MERILEEEKNIPNRVGDIEGGHIKQGEENYMFVIQLNKLLHFLQVVQTIQNNFYLTYVLGKQLDTSEVKENGLANISSQIDLSSMFR